MKAWKSGMGGWFAVGMMALALGLATACDDPEIDEGPPAAEEEAPTTDGDGRIIFEDVAEEAEGRAPAEVPDDQADAPADAPDEMPDPDEGEPPEEMEDLQEEFEGLDGDEE